MKLNLLSDKIGWFGKYSGYECLPHYLPPTVEQTVHAARYNFYNKLLGKYYKVQNNWNNRSEDIFNEIKFARNIGSSDAAHILYLESHLHLTAGIKDTSKLFGTIHLPFSRWGKQQLNSLANLQNVLLLYKEEAELFQQYIPQNQIKVIRHGVDINFFKPGKPELVKRGKLLFVGHFLRNFDMMLRVFEMLCKQVSNSLEFHFIIPSTFRDIPALAKMQAKPNVFFHEKLSDEELLLQYQTSNLLVMPMQDSGANTAIIQGLSVGVPILTTDVGGIRSYGGGEVYPIVQNNDVVGMCELINKYLADTDYRNHISQQQRSFSLNYLDWNHIARQHVKAYSQSILQDV